VFASNLFIGPAMRRFALVVPLVLLLGVAFGDQVYQQPDAFLRSVFSGHVPEPRLLWITKDLEPRVKEILGHDLGVLRVRYWQQDGRTAWILEEIGKEQPITTGIVVDKGKIEQLKVLIFRESRGSEVRYPFFTDQFHGAGLADDHLDRHIDSISGATLSVRAVTKLARLALFLTRQVQSESGAHG
jgi:FMN-binding domain